MGATCDLGASWLQPGYLVQPGVFSLGRSRGTMEPLAGQITSNHNKTIGDTEPESIQRIRFKENAQAHRA